MATATLGPNSGTPVAFLRQLRERHSGPLNLIWDNAPAHRGEAMTCDRLFGFNAVDRERTLAICAWEARRR